ncbi:hypothetical protein TNCV_4280941 [Trichonephila clavipes]|nr:hypothetical protein TNCV_4280941 [Trichonephila clavipes]
MPQISDDTAVKRPRCTGCDEMCRPEGRQHMCVDASTDKQWRPCKPLLPPFCRTEGLICFHINKKNYHQHYRPEHFVASGLYSWHPLRKLPLTHSMIDQDATSVESLTTASCFAVPLRTILGHLSEVPSQMSSSSRGGRSSLMVKVCDEFEPSTTEDPSCREAMHVKSVETQASSRWRGVEVRRRGASSDVVLVT